MIRIGNSRRSGSNTDRCGGPGRAMTPTEAAILIMAKAPHAGSVKTRLQPLLGPQGCARLQAALIRRTVRLAQLVAPARTYLALDPLTAKAELIGLIPTSIAVLAQSGPDLGSRMSAAAADVFRRHHGPLLLIGTDAPTLTAPCQKQAGELLVAGQDAVFGAAVDGGYYLVGMARPMPELFTIDPALWGGSEVLLASLAAARETGLRVGLLPALRDLDTPQDAADFLTEGALPEEIAALLRGTARVL